MIRFDFDSLIQDEKTKVNIKNNMDEKSLKINFDDFEYFFLECHTYQIELFSPPPKFSGNVLLWGGMVLAVPTSASSA